MTKITVEIDCDMDFCSYCRHVIYTRDNMSWRCGIFRDNEKLEISDKNRIIRCKECLEAEVKDDKDNG